MYKCLLCSICCWLSLVTAPVCAQDSTYFGLVDKTGTGSFKKAPIRQGHKYLAARQVYDKLVAARGDFRYPVPAFIFSKTKLVGASMSAGNLEIVLEEAAYDICADFGKDSLDAIAALLGHELIHYYEKHVWRKNFLKNFDKLDYTHSFSAAKSSLESIINESSLPDAKKTAAKGKIAQLTHITNIASETQSDYLGGFLAFSAGYDVFDKHGDLIEALYEDYDIAPDASDRYPSLADRKSLSGQSTDLLEHLVWMFQMANYLTIVEEYEQARIFYRRVLNDFQSREIYNNLGVAAFLEAAALFDDAEMPFTFPVELELSSGFNERNLGLLGKNERREALLREAIKHFDYAIHLDADYAPAYLNKACAYTLLEDFTAAKFYGLREGRIRALADARYSKTVDDLKILEGILLAMSGDKTGAAAVFDAVEGGNSRLAQYNKTQLEGNTPSLPNPLFARIKPERINGIALALYAEEPPVDTEQRLSKNLMFYTYEPPQQEGSSRILLTSENGGSRNYYFHITGKDYTGKTREGCQIGTPYSVFISKYGKPDRSLELFNGTLAIYPARRAIFRFGADGKLAGWTAFFKEEF